MADPNLQYDPVNGWEDTTETVFKTNPNDAEVRPMFQRLFNQIRDWINNTFTPWINTTFTKFTDVLSKTNTTAFTPTASYHPATKKYVDDTTANVVLGQIPDGSLTDAKLSNTAGQIKDTVANHLVEKSTDTVLGHIKQGTGVNIDVNGVLSVATGSAGFKKASSTYTDNDASQTFVDAYCTANSLVTIVITSATPPQGVWSVNSAAGSFTITSTVTESADITFDYYIQKAVV